MKNPLETEVKYHLREIDPVRNAILALGAVCRGRFFEINICFDDKEQTLLKKKALLRLRKDQKNTLTFKSRAVFFDPDVKVMEEIEVAVGDFDATRKILCALGFSETMRYEKWRETFSLGNTAILIDSMPFGDFLEIEGEKQAIRLIGAEIGLPWENRILLNYLDIFETLKTRLQLSFRDITFENFKNCPVDAVTFTQFSYGSKSEASVNRKS